MCDALRAQCARARDDGYMTRAEYDHKCRGLAAQEADAYPPGFKAQVQALRTRAGEAGRGPARS